MAAEKLEIEAPPKAPVMRGRLGIVCLASLLHLLESEAFDGFLVLEGRATLELRQGHIIHVRAGDLTGLTALHSLFFLDGDVFLVIPGEPPPGAVLGTTMELVMEAYRLIDEWARLAPMILAATPAAREASSLAELLPLLDGVATVGELVAELERSPVQLIDPLLDALARGLVTVVARDAEASCSPPKPEEFYELLDTGRALMRKGDLTRAATMLRRAVRAQPENRLARQNLRRVVELSAMTP